MCSSSVCPHTLAIVASAATYAAPLGLYPSGALSLVLALIPIGVAVAVAPAAGISAVLALACVAIFT
jgi:hypothetical protein